MTTTINSAGLTDIGRHRESNEDGFLILDLGHLSKAQSSQHLPGFQSDVPGPQLLVVADGMGGHANGGKASELAIDAFGQYIRDHVHAFDPSLDDPAAVLRQLEAAMRVAHEAIEDFAGNHSEPSGIGTTLTAVVIVWPCIYVAHVGDSRCYVLTARQPEQLTADHTLGDLLTAKKSVRGDNDNSERTIWNVLAHGATRVQIDTFHRNVEGAEAVLLCTDGMHGHLNDDQMASIVVANGPEAACHRLIDAAKDAGGQDNITVVVARFANGEPAVADTTEAEVPLEDVIRETERKLGTTQESESDDVHHEMEYVEEQIPATG